jgi:hypothetical protein
MLESKEGGVKEPWLRNENFLEAGLQIMGTQAPVPSHCDSHELPAWSYHLILVNSGFIVRHPEEEASYMPIQPAGSLVRFSVHEQHTLTHDYRSPQSAGLEAVEGTVWESQEPGWASIHFGSDEQMDMMEAFVEMKRRLVKLEELLEEHLIEGALYPEHKTEP